jgi:hypothetical protein
MSRNSSYTPEKAEAFLKRLKGTEGNVTLATKSLSLTGHIVRQWRLTNPEFDSQITKVLAEVKLK